MRTDAGHDGDRPLRLSPGFQKAQLQQEAPKFDNNPCAPYNTAEIMQMTQRGHLFLFMRRLKDHPNWQQQ